MFKPLLTTALLAGTFSVGAVELRSADVHNVGLNTPPVGTTKFVGCAIGEMSVGEVMRSILPSYGVLTVMKMLVTYVPTISRWLPGLFK